jgi:hypothetical protein
MGFLDELKDKRLLPTQKNALAKAATKLGFSVDEFEWAEEDMWEHHLNYTNSEGQVYPRFDRQYRVSVLKHRGSGYVCKFGPISVEHSPAKRTIADKRVFNGDAERLAIFREWLRLLKREGVPDLWATVAQETALPKGASSPSLDNRPFTSAECSHIHAKLDEIKSYILEGQQFAAEQAETVEREFAYLKESSERLGRKDWLTSFLGVLMSLVIGFAFDPVKAKGILRLAGEAFQSLWGVAAGYLQ